MSPVRFGEAANLAEANGLSLKTRSGVLHTADADGSGILRLLGVRAAGITVPVDYVERAGKLADKDLDAAADLATTLGTPGIAVVEVAADP